MHRLEESIAAANVTLSVDDLAQIDAALAQIQVVSDRYGRRLPVAAGLLLRSTCPANHIYQCERTAGDAIAASFRTCRTSGNDRSEILFSSLERVIRSRLHLF